MLYSLFCANFLSVRKYISRRKDKTDRMQPALLQNFLFRLYQVANK